jgi:hypothetical protein
LCLTLIDFFINSYIAGISTIYFNENDLKGK